MATLLEYLGNEFASFDEKPLGPVDSAALSQFCMVRSAGLIPQLKLDRKVEGLPTPFRHVADRLAARRLRSVAARIADEGRSFAPPALLSAAPDRVAARLTDLLCAEKFPDMFTGFTPGLIKDNVVALAASPRFRTLAVTDYQSVFDEGEHAQFAAMTFVHVGATREQDFAYIGFRGTDATVTGWREDFDMAYSDEVEAQRRAVAYVEAVAPHLPQRLYLGGHSKGGNLAVYAALTVPPAIRDRIVMVFDHDGPGFKHGLFRAADYDRLAGRLDKTVPVDSVVGMLMEYLGPTRVVHASDAGMMQHSPFTWEVDVDTGDFSYAPDVSENAKFVRDVFSEWLSGFSDKEAEELVDALFDAIKESDIQDAALIFTGGLGELKRVFDAAGRIAPKKQAVLSAGFAALRDIALRRLGKGIIASLGRRKTD